MKRHLVIVTAVIWTLATSLGCGSPDASEHQSSSSGGGGPSTGSSGGGGSGNGGDGGGGGHAAQLVVHAGSDQTIAAPATSVTLHGSALDTPGAKLAYAWTQTSGVTATIGTPTKAATTVTGMLPGVYVFRLTVHDDKGRHAKDSVQVTVTSSGTIHYVSTSGSDATGDGTSAKPWASLSKACDAVTSAGDTIHIVAGDYDEPNQCVLAPRVNLEGEGDASHIRLNFMTTSFYAGSIYLYSDTEGTNGDQSISKLSLDGNAVGFNAIMVRARSNVTIHDCTFTDFKASAVSFNGRIGQFATPPSIYATGNQMYDNTTTDCSDRQQMGGGVITMSGQDGILIYGNKFHQVGRATGHNGNVIGAVEGYNKGMKYYDNVSDKPVSDGDSQWNFGIESWNDGGGMEVYGNTFNGGGDAIDVGTGGGKKGTYDYGWYVHDNLFQIPSPLPMQPAYSLPMGVQFECAATDAMIVGNHFKNTVVGVQLLLSHMETTDMERVYIHNNLFENMGYLESQSGSFMVNLDVRVPRKIDSVYVDNNTMVAGPTGLSRAALRLGAFDGSISNVYFRNNIVENVVTYGYLTFDGNSPNTIQNVFSQNNILHGNANDDDANTLGTVTVTGFTKSHIITKDPLLDGSFHPKPGSPALGAGLDLGYGTDIGAYP